MTARFWILQSVGAVLFVAAWFMGWPQMMSAGDPTHITPGIGLVGLIGILCAARGKWKAAEFISYELPVLGLLGTFVGLQMVIASSGGDFEAIRQGLGTAFYTTIAGILGAAWLRLSQQLA